MNEVLDISSISFEDLQEEYKKLKDRFSQLVALSEQDRQKIHELKRSLDTATAAEAYLAQELDQLSSIQLSHDDALLHKKQNELDELKKRQSALITENEELHEDVASLRAENGRLKQEIKELNAASRPAEISYHIPKEYLELRDKLESENLELLAKLDETHESVVKFTLALAEKEKHIEIFKDQVLCLEENLQSKREEIDEKSHLLESAQEQVVEMNSKIALLTSCPNNADRKGNSLFAEVDDQRQAMKQLLAAQKKSYMQMKKVYTESQHEIRRLKRENVAMHTELRSCSTIFCSADKVYKEKLNERILQLLKQNEDLENKLMVTQQELLSIANDKGVMWLDSMLLFCKQETDEMKKELHSIRIQKGILEESLRNTQQELAKWRFEGLKTRCILIDRESLLTDNKIEFKAFTNRDVSFSESELKNARPNLGFQNNENKNVKPIHSLEKVDGSVIVIEEDDPDHNRELIKVEPDLIIKIKEEEKNPTIRNVKLEIFEDEQNICEKINCNEQIEISRSLEDSPIAISAPEYNHGIQIKLSNIENKENICVLDKETLPNICAKTSLREFNINSTTPEIINESKLKASILTSKKDVLADENTKTVQFANVKNDDSSENKVISKPMRNKSSLVVRRIRVGSKTKEEPGAPILRH